MLRLTFIYALVDIALIEKTRLFTLVASCHETTVTSGDIISPRELLGG